MKTSSRVLKLATVLVLLSNGLSAQDIHFSQFSMTPLLLNPAMAGANYEVEGIINYKSQWAGVADFKTLNASYDMRAGHKKAKKGFWGIGINFFSDKGGNGRMGTSFGNLNAAYHVFLNNKSMLGGGLYGGFGQRSITNYNALAWGNQYDGTAYNPALASGEPSAPQSFSFPDLGGGIVYTYKSNERYSTANDQFMINVGAASFHVIRPTDAFYASRDSRLFMKNTAFVNTIIGIPNSNISAAPGIFYSRQGPSQEIFLGSYVKFRMQDESKITGFKKGSAISLGGFYRYRDAAVISAMLEYSGCAIGLSYDINVSQLKRGTNGNGGLEISLRFVKPNPFATAKARI